VILQPANENQRTSQKFKIAGSNILFDISGFETVLS
jgi:hypothetical protein